MKKITILALHLGYGGIEKFITNLSNSLSNDYEIEIISTYKIFDTPFFKLNEKVKVKYLINNLKPNKKEIEKSLKKLKLITLIKELYKSVKILYLKKYKMINYIKNCDSHVIISTRDIHNKWLGKYGNKNAIKIATEHNHHDNNKKYIKKIVDSTKGLNYFVVVSNELKKFYKSLVKCPVICIPNSIERLPNKVSDLNNKTIISVGRLEKIKGFNDLIDIFDIVLKKYPDWNLNIVGDGSEFDALQDLINQKKLNNSIKLLGYKNSKELDKLYQESSIYVMSSLNESFGIVLLEAMSYRIPCIAFDSANGAKEIISNNWDGYLIDNRDKNKMAKKIINLINDENRRIIMGNNAYKKANKYLSQNIKQEWIDLIEK
ncbi:MAG: glycosyltransferase [Bacilli bacterium]|nr:glycosyltransferase [Bacilli bacterium]